MDQFGEIPGETLSKPRGGGGGGLVAFVLYDKITELSELKAPNLAQL